MTKSLEKAIQTVRELPEDLQDIAADRLLRCLDFMALDDSEIHQKNDDR